MGSDASQTGLRHQPKHRSALIVMMLQEQPSPRRQGDAGSSENLADGRQSVGTTIERKGGFMLAHPGFQVGQGGTGNVGRIADNELQISPP